MKTTIVDKLLHFAKSKGLSVLAFEKSVGLSNGYFNIMKRRKGSVGSDIISKIVEVYPDLNLKWLFTGDAEMNLREGWRNSAIDVKGQENPLIIQYTEDSIKEEFEKLKSSLIELRLDFDHLKHKK